MTTMMTNGRARKTLADQIDRLDAILDGLADALNQAVAEAVKEAVAVAVQAAVAETLAHPELRRRVTPAAERPSPLRRLLAKVRRAAGAVTAGVCGFARRAAAAVAGAPRAVAARVAGAWITTRGMVAAVARSVPAWPGLVWRLRAAVLLAVGVGGTVAVACYLAGPAVAAAVGGLAGARDTLRAHARRLRL
ncbi:MAG TPA: hypothetical protein VGF55_13205 [Gemmataceae bacterium]|jgi:hypothetical protein